MRPKPYFSDSEPASATSYVSVRLQPDRDRIVRLAWRHAASSVTFRDGR